MISKPTTHTLPHEQEMRTPPWLYAEVCRLCGVERFELDAFASAENTLCSVYCDEEADGLLMPWLNPTFCNPPFSLMAQVVDKALVECERGVTVGLIGPSGCSQRWFHKLIKKALVYFPDKRLQFLGPDGEAKKGAMQDSAVYIFNWSFDFASPDLNVLHVPR